jgi:hypothetical protein
LQYFYIKISKPNFFRKEGTTLKLSHSIQPGKIIPPPRKIGPGAQPRPDFGRFLVEEKQNLQSKDQGNWKWRKIGWTISSILFRISQHGNLGAVVMIEKITLNFEKFFC